LQPGLKHQNRPENPRVIAAAGEMLQPATLDKRRIQQAMLPKVLLAEKIGGP
jgi:hypothetical protein